MAEEYAALEAYLTERAEAGQFRVVLTFEQIEGITRAALPQEAREDRHYWEGLAQSQQDFARPMLYGWEASLDPEQRIVTFYNRWHERRREDLADKYAIIVALPSTKLEPVAERPREPLRWDDPDFGRHGEHFHREFGQLIEEAVRRYAPDPDGIAIYRQEYEIGPAAQSWPMWLFLLDLDTAANIVEVSTFSYLVARYVIQRFRQWLRASGVYAGEVWHPTFTKPILAAMCEGHVREKYHPRAKITTAAYGIDQHSLVTSQHHPGFEEVYVVDCRVGRKTYTFQIDDHATVQSFVLREGKVTAVLPLPDWMEEGPTAKHDN